MKEFWVADPLTPGLLRPKVLFFLRESDVLTLRTIVMVVASAVSKGTC